MSASFELFGAAATCRSNGCLAGAAPLPITGRSWQVMRLSRNRNWGNQSMMLATARIFALVLLTARPGKRRRLAREQFLGRG
jgi:murein endopeptidase